MSGLEVKGISIHVGSLVVILGQALLLAFLLGRQVDRLDIMERRLGYIDEHGTDATKLLAERQQVVMRNVDDLLKRVGTLERGSRNDH